MTNAEKRKAREAERKRILNLMKEVLVELLEEGELSDPAKYAAVELLNEVRIELHLDHVY